MFYIAARLDTAMDLPRTNDRPEQHPKLGPEGPFYDPLPTPTSIRVLLLAPGQLEDEICCYFFPSDLDKDRAVDPTSPRPFKSLSFAEASGLGCEDAERKFALHVDMYTEERQGDAASASDISTPSCQQQTASSKGEEPSTNSSHVNPTLSEVIDSFATSDAPEMEVAVDEYLRDYSRLADNETFIDRVRRIVYEFVIHYLSTILVGGSLEHNHAWI